MTGFELIFIAPRGRKYAGQPVLDAVADLAKSLGITGVTRRDDIKGTGAHGHTHSAHFFELTEEPQELMFVLDNDVADKLIQTVEAAEIPVFCIRRSVDYWQFGRD